MTPVELNASTVAVRAYVNKVAGWYASYITDDMCRGVAAAAIGGYVAAHTPPTAKPKAEAPVGQDVLDALERKIVDQVGALEDGR